MANVEGGVAISGDASNNHPPVASLEHDIAFLAANGKEFTTWWRQVARDEDTLPDAELGTMSSEELKRHISAEIATWGNFDRRSATAVADKNMAEVKRVGIELSYSNISIAAAQSILRKRKVSTAA